MKFRLIAVLLTSLLLHACTTPSATGRRESSTQYPPPVSTIPEEEQYGQGETEIAYVPPTRVPQPLEAEPIAPPSYPKTAGEVSGQAVVSLMQMANEASAKGQYDLAASQLERAQRIEPRNYFVWSAMAKVYLKQEQYAQAISVAGKSNSLARGNIYVELENYKTIASARRSSGDSLGALQAEAKIEELERVGR